MIRTFSDRVNYAARYIASGRQTNRTFDSCFENYDGEAVVLALCLRAVKNEKLRQLLPRYVAETSIREIPLRHAGRKPADVSRECISLAMAAAALRCGEEFAASLHGPVDRVDGQPSLLMLLPLETR